MKRRLHTYLMESGQMAIFDQTDSLVVDCTAGEMSDADANEVVRRWNLHDELVEALEGLNGEHVRMPLDAWNRVREALARAKAKPLPGAERRNPAFTVTNKRGDVIEFYNDAGDLGVVR